MSRFGLLRSLLVFAAFTGLALAPIPALAQHGGGGHGGGGGSHGGGGGGGGFHGGGGSHGGARSSGGGGEYHGGGFRGSRSDGGFGASRGMIGRSGGSEAGRNFGDRDHSSNFRPAINDGQWHSFGNSGSSARLSEGRNSGGLANSSLSARNAGISDGAWHSFGSSRGASGFVAGVSHAAPGFGRGGDGWRGAWPGYGWGGGWGWGRGWGWGWGGWGFGFGWPYWGGYWGPGWAFGWDPWWYAPYGYASPYYIYPDYSYDWSDDPPPYRPDTSLNYDSPESQVSTTSSN